MICRLSRLQITVPYGREFTEGLLLCLETFREESCFERHRCFLCMCWLINGDKNLYKKFDINWRELANSRIKLDLYHHLLGMCDMDCDILEYAVVSAILSADTGCRALAPSAYHCWQHA